MHRMLATAPKSCYDVGQKSKGASYLPKTETGETMKEIKIVYEGGEGELIEKKSRFIATVRPVESEEEALGFIAAMKKKYWNATHNCSAFVVGENQELQRCSDDGEPQGTAGRPMLDVLLGEEIHNAAVVVTRYFGGTLLGTGGLVRAYQDSVRENLQTLPQAERVPSLAVDVSLAYAHVDRVRRLLPDFEAVILAEDYAADARLRLRLPEALWPPFAEAVAARTDGRAVCRIIGDEA